MALAVVLVMCNRVFCRFNTIPQHLHRNRIIHSVRQFKNSSVVLKRVEDLSKLLDQGKRSILKIKSKDNVPDDYQLIYKAPMELTMRLGYFTLVSSSLGLFATLVYRHYNVDNLVMGKRAGRDNNIVFLNPQLELWVFSIGLLSLVLAGSSLMFKYPFRVYKHCSKKEYIGLFLNPTLPTLRKIQFTSANPAQFKNPLYLMMDGCHYVLNNNKKTFFMSHCFRVPKDLTDMYDDLKNLKG